MASADWDQLLQVSEDLAATGTQGFPLVQRDLQQVEQLSQQLKGRTRRKDAGDDSLAAARLLAQEGVSAQKISKQLQAFEIKPSYEDVAPSGAASLDDYLQQVHEMTVVAAIKEAQANTVNSFESFMARCRAAEWAAAKRDMFGMGEANGSLPRSPKPLRTPPGNQGAAAMDAGAAAEQQLSALEKAYLDVVRRLNAAASQNSSFDAASEFAAASASSAAQGSDHKTTMAAVWKVLVHMLQGQAASQAPSAMSLLKGAREYLEAGYIDFVTDTIRGHRAQAALGGEPSRRKQVRAFLRVREASRGSLDFDAPGGADTTWQRIFLCLRCSFHQDALEEARPLSGDVVGQGGSFEGRLREWVRLRGHLPPTSATIMASECARLMGAADAAAARAPAFQYKLLLYTLLSGNRTIAEQVLQGAIQSHLLATIEDFLWFTIALIQPPPTDADAGRISGEAYRLGDVQEHLARYPAEHYSAQGREPLLYAIVLLLSVQPRACTAFLAKHPSASVYRTDAAHLAIALLHHQVWSLGGPKDQSGVEASALIQRYGQSFAAAAPEIALEYYMLAAEAAGGGAEVKGQLLRDLLTQSNAFGFLLGSGSSGGALDRLLPQRRERVQVLAIVARECQQAGQNDWAVELWEAAEQHEAALRLLSHQLALLIPAAIHNPQQEGELQQLLVRGNSIASKLAVATGSQAVAETEAFATLKLLRRLLRASHSQNQGEAAAALAELSFLPQEQFRVQRCVEAAAQLHPAVAHLLAPAVAAGGRALAAQRQRKPLQALAAYAGSLRQRIPRDIIQQLNHLQSELA